MIHHQLAQAAVFIAAVFVFAACVLLVRKAVLDYCYRDD
jgi:hypothetical protein